MSSEKKLKAGDILLLFLYVDNASPIKGKTRIQKVIFIYEKEIHEQYGFNKKLHEQSLNVFHYIAFNYGPFSKKVYELLEFFENIGLVAKRDTYSCISQNPEECLLGEFSDFVISEDDEQNIEDNEKLDQPIEPEYQLTEKGIKYVKDKILPFITLEQFDILEKTKISLNKMTLNILLSYVYHKYEDMTINSEIKDKISRFKA